MISCHLGVSKLQQIQATVCYIMERDLSQFEQQNKMSITVTDIFLFLVFCIFLSLSILLKLIYKKNSTKHRRPPGPLMLPVIGNILSFGILPHLMMPHQTIEKLKAKYGPVIWLELGMTKTLAIQSANAALEAFKKHDLAFSDRFIPDSATACDHHKSSLFIGRYGDYWRVARKLCSAELLAHKKVSASAPTRRSCIDIMMQWIKEDSDSSSTGEIDLERYLMLMTFNMLSNLTMSRDIVMSSKCEKGNEFYEALTALLKWTGMPNVVDGFPFLKWIDPQRIRRNSEKHGLRLFDIINGFVEERIQEKKLGYEKAEGKDFLDALLDYGGKDGIDELPMKNVICLIMEMFMAGTETTSTSINWAMAELLRKPETLQKLKDEIDQFSIGSSRMVEEDDIDELPYLMGVVKETMRLHPAAPFIPREALQDTEFMGYFIPKHTVVIVSTWAIHRDPETWKDPLSFEPERFLDTNIDSKVQRFEFIPFGFGRRSCIGTFLGEKMVGLTLAKIIQTFDWKLPANTSSHNLDMTERNGLTIRKRVPLMVIPAERKR